MSSITSKCTKILAHVGGGVEALMHYFPTPPSKNSCMKHCYVMYVCATTYILKIE